METFLLMNDLMSQNSFTCLILLQETIVCQDNAGIKMLCWLQILRKSLITTGRAALLEELIYKSLTENTYVLFTIMSFSFPQR